jgi:hypothetical protein
MTSDLTLPDVHEMPEWFAEYRRLLAEAEARLAAGDVRPAIASLAAMPNVHGEILTGCDELLARDADAPEPDPSVGLYF